jgi:hypothetical protein
MYGYIRPTSKISKRDVKVLDCVIKNNKLLTWENNCKYKGKTNVVNRKRKDEVGYIQSKIRF